MLYLLQYPTYRSDIIILHRANTSYGIRYSIYTLTQCNTIPVHKLEPANHNVQVHYDV